MSHQGAHPVNDELRQGFDLLKLIRPVVVSPVFPYLIQAVLLLVFVWLAVLVANGTARFTSLPATTGSTHARPWPPGRLRYS